MRHTPRHYSFWAPGLLAVLALLASCTLLPAALAPAQPAPAVSAPSAVATPTGAAGSGNFATITEIWNILQQDFVDRKALDAGKLSRGAIKGMLEALNDPYTAYVDPNSFRVEQESLRGTFEGIGAVVAIREGQLIIVAPIASSPAEKAGLRPGDAIMAVNGEPTKDMGLQDAVLKIRGPRGSMVKLTIRHQGDQGPVDVEIVRAEVRVETVSLQVPEDKLAILRIAQFNQRTDQEVMAALREARRQGAKGIVLDLRNNPGGLLDVTVAVASQFLKSGLVLYEIDSQGRRKDWGVQSGGLATDLPLTVLVNQFSASGSEVLTGALQSNKRAPVVGVKTFGKGSVNIIRPLSDGGGLYVTHARWYTPDGQLIEGKGLQPDVEVPLPTGSAESSRDVQLEKAHDILVQQIAQAR
ncbi:MAG: S41 family peptidase [Chloroflexi bacterium]|nr:S41 family peptidase [Chloroflexota bacterium]